jgi:hypothetical protein
MSTISTEEYMDVHDLFFPPLGDPILIGPTVHGLMESLDPNKIGPVPSKGIPFRVGCDYKLHMGSKLYHKCQVTQVDRSPTATEGTRPTRVRYRRSYQDEKGHQKYKDIEEDVVGTIHSAIRLL